MSLEDGQIVDRHPCYPCIKYQERNTDVDTEKAVIIETITPTGERKYECGRGKNDCSILTALMKK